MIAIALLFEPALIVLLVRRLLVMVDTVNRHSLRIWLRNETELMLVDTRMFAEIRCNADKNVDVFVQLNSVHFSDKAKVHLEKLNKLTASGESKRPTDDVLRKEDTGRESETPLRKKRKLEASTELETESPNESVTFTSSSSQRHTGNEPTLATTMPTTKIQKPSATVGRKTCFNRCDEPCSSIQASNGAVTKRRIIIKTYSKQQPVVATTQPNTSATGILRRLYNE